MLIDHEIQFEKMAVKDITFWFVYNNLKCRNWKAHFFLEKVWFHKILWKEMLECGICIFSALGRNTCSTVNTECLMTFHHKWWNKQDCQLLFSFLRLSIFPLRRRLSPLPLHPPHPGKQKIFNLKLKATTWYAWVRYVNAVRYAVLYCTVRYWIF
jgi:hypothetical protein